METVHNVTNLCALFDVSIDATCTSNVVQKVPNEQMVAGKIALVVGMPGSLHEKKMQIL